MTLDEFCEKCSKRDIPSNPMARVKTYARELAEGALYGLWNINFNYYAVLADNPDMSDSGRGESAIHHYTMHRWGNLDDAPTVDLLVRLNYLENIGVDGYSSAVAIRKEAFDLLSDVDALNVFISYKRSESSAFALLIHDRLRASGLNPFVDMQLQAGMNWQKQLKSNIRDADYLIALIGRGSLHSGELIKEMTWAVAAKIPIIPIWHQGFHYRTADWTHILPDRVDQALHENHTIRVIEENPLMYDMAIRELLNRFGITG
ncbi:MAG: toll/interleukin-1 receptor domain-containing protein [Chloroflexota bacterium]